jgi:hypothetical protein
MVLIWIKNAGHNSNTDAPELLNTLIADFIKGLDEPIHLYQKKDKQKRTILLILFWQECSGKHK